MKGRSTAPRWFKETSRPSSALATAVIRRVLAHHVLQHDGGFGGLAGHLVVFLQRHDEHGVRVFLEFDDIGHSPYHVAVGGFREGGLVDRAVSSGEAVIGPVEFAAALVAVFLRPAIVLRLKDAAGQVAQADQGGEPPAE